jgi:hypothetical protein
MKNRVRLFWHVLKSMPEYSSSLPTGTTVGKVWSRRHPYRALDHEAEWYVGTYVKSTVPGNVLIRWFGVDLVQGPAPPHYRPPDWHNTKEYERALTRNRMPLQP